jgi:hypothetical protein
MIKRKHSSVTTSGFIELTPLVTTDRGTNYNKVACILYGYHHTKSGRLLAFAEPPPNVISKLRYRFNLLMGRDVVFDPSTVPEGKDFVFDMVNNITLYNTAFYMTQKTELVCSMSVPDVTRFIKMTITEQGLINELFGVTWPRFNVLYPLYQMNAVVDITYGIEVLDAIMSYLNTSDRRHIDMGPKELCLQLLESLVYTGLTTHTTPWDHPPIPTTNRFYKGSVGFVRSIYQIWKLPNFGTLSMCDQDKHNIVDHRIVPVMPLDATVTKKFVSLTDNNSLVTKKVMYIHNTKSKLTHKNIVFVYGSKNEARSYEYLPHCLHGDITREQSMIQYLVDVFKIDVTTKTFWRTINNYTDTSRVR